MNEQVIIDREAPPWAQRLQTDLNATFTRLTRRVSTIQTAASGTVNVVSSGADPTGVADSAGAIQAAIDALPEGGGTVEFPAGTYLVSSTITIGNGTASSRSSRVGVKLRGLAGGGVGEGEFSEPNAGVIIRYTGASGSSTPVIQLTGPIHSCVLEDLTIDCNNLAGRGVTAIHPYQCRFVNVQVEKWSNVGFYLTSHNTMPTGVTQGIMDNLFIQCQARTPNGTAGHGFLLEGYDHASAWVPCSRNVFIHCHALIPGAAGSSGMKMVFADNNHVERFTANWGSGTVLGHGLILQGSTAHTGLCQENQFSNCSFVGGYNLTGGTNGNNLFLGYNTSDGAPLPSFGQGQKFLLPDGRGIGGFAGSVISWAGRTDPGSGAGTVLKYLAPQGVSAQQASRFDADFCLPSGYKLVALRTNLGVVPGGATTRVITVLKNGSATAATITYTAAQSGDKRWSDSAGVDFSGGDMICIRSDVTGAPTNSNVQYALEFYPVEVV